MFRYLLFFIPLIINSYILQRSILSYQKLYGIKLIDHNIENKTIYEKFEYYSLMNNREKQNEYLEIILDLSKNKTNI